MPKKSKKNDQVYYKNRSTFFKPTEDSEGCHVTQTVTININNREQAQDTMSSCFGSIGESFKSCFKGIGGALGGVK